MTEVVNEIRALVDLAKRYADVKIEIFKSQTEITISKLVSLMTTGILIGSIFTVAIFMFTLGLSYAAGEWLGNTAKGFYLVGGCFLFLAIVLFVISKAFLQKYIQNEIIQKLDEDL